MSNKALEMVKNGKGSKEYKSEILDEKVFVKSMTFTQRAEFTSYMKDESWEGYPEFLAKMVIDKVLDENKEPLFAIGDYDAIVNDDTGLIDELSGFVIHASYKQSNPAEDIEKAKKK